eukprot:snap_masked-scaffold_2-processed-gene-25.42-mRNA-1 protein AED:1.00 eAED:1.00 QI:0/-1/0/0/-1/1/1/0/91
MDEKTIRIHDMKTTVKPLGTIKHPITTNIAILKDLAAPRYSGKYTIPQDKVIHFPNLLNLAQISRRNLDYGVVHYLDNGKTLYDGFKMIKF